jgi:uncharacterized repeat protein (TIGR01451 family)
MTLSNYPRLPLILLSLYLFSNPVGAQWVKLPPPCLPEILAVSTSNGRVVAAANGGLFYSDDKGVHWNAADVSPALIQYPFVDGARILHCSQALYAFGKGGNFLRSADDGLSWQAVNMPAALLGSAIGMITDSTQLWFFSQHNIWHYDPSTNLSDLIGDFSANNLVDMAVGGQHLYAMASEGVFRYDPAAGAWNQVLTATGPAQTSIAAQADSVWTVTADSTLLRSTNAGDAWQNLGKHPWLSKLYYTKGRLFSMDGYPAVPLGLGVYASSDGGLSWSDFYQESGPIPALAIDIEDDQTVIAGRSGVLIRQKDSTNWVLYPQGFGTSTNFNIFEAAGDALYENIYLQSAFSFDRGNSWVGLPFTNTFGSLTQLGNDWFGVSRRYGNNIPTGNQAVYKISQGGKHLDVTGAFQPPNAVPIQLFTFQGSLFAIGFKTQGSVYTMTRSDDHGASWQDLGNLSFPSPRIAVFNGKIYAASYGLPLKSSTDGIDWTTEANVPINSPIMIWANEFGLFISDYSHFWRRQSQSNTYQELPFSDNCFYDTHNQSPIYDVRLVDSFLYVPCYKQLLRYNFLSNLLIDLSPDVDFKYSVPWYAFQKGYAYTGGATDPGGLLRLDVSQISNTRHVDGLIFRDDNLNGLFDPGEKPIPNALFKYGPELYLTADQNGAFALDYLFPYDSIKPRSVYHPYIASISPAAYALTGSDSGITFAVQQIPNIKDFTVNSGYSPNFRAGFTTSISIVVNNTGSVQQQASIRLVLDNNVHFQSASIPPDLINMDTIVWNIGTIDIWDSRVIFVSVQTDQAALVGQPVQYQVDVLPDQNDQTPLNNHIIRNATVHNAHDPNLKEVDPTTYTNTDFLAGIPLTYTIRFQNTGNAPAERVRITDVLDPALDPGSFQFLCSSHPCTWKITGKGVIEFRFDQINLPDSVSDNSGSEGFVSFSLMPKTWMPVGANISNTADIYFDFNKAIHTNTASTAVGIVRRTTAEQSPAPAAALELAPNPTTDWVIAQTPDARGYIEIITAKGETAGRIAVRNAGTLVDLKDFPNGIYLLRWYNDGRCAIGKVVVAH